MGRAASAGGTWRLVVGRGLIEQGLTLGGGQVARQAWSARYQGESLRGLWNPQNRVIYAGSSAL